MSSTFSIGGAVSGFDTNDIIDQLMALERQPINRLAAQRDEQRGIDEAWGQVASKLSALDSAVGDIANASDLRERFAASSSDEDVVEARITDASDVYPGVHDVSVEQLATTSEAISGDFSDPDEVIAEDGGTFTMEIGGDDVEVTVQENATMRDLVRAVNDAGVGARASIVRTGEATYKLVLTSRDTGQSSFIRVTGTPDGFPEGVDDFTYVDGQDAKLHYGSIEVTRESNVVDDVIEGIELDLRAAEPGRNVRIDVSQDVDDTVAQVSGMVDAFNALLETADELGRSAEDAEDRGPLAGDSSLRSMANRLRGAISGGLVGPDGLVPSNDIGIQLTRDGELTLNEGRLRDALEADFDGTVGLLGRAATFDEEASPGIVGAASGSRTQPGEYDVEITAAATRAEVVEAWTGDLTQDSDLTVTHGSREATLTLTAGTDLTTAIEQINDALEEAGIAAVQAYDDDGDLALRSPRWGSSGTFEVAATGDLAGLEGTHEGADVEGTIGGVDATGSGRILRGDGDATGLRVTTAATEDDVADAGGTFDAGSVRVTDGLGGALDRVVDRYEGGGGIIDRTRDRIEGRIDRLEDRMVRFEDRLELRRRTLERQFAGMEVAMARLMDQGQRLAAQMGGLQGGMS